jgi:hypothetical protein
MTPSAIMSHPRPEPERARLNLTHDLNHKIGAILISSCWVQVQEHCSPILPTAV